MNFKITYQGGLRNECVHLQSGTKIETDAPTDNKGKGERFSPTDLVCVALATCIITTMGIRANDMEVDLAGAEMDVSKYMLSGPRRIGKIEVFLTIPKTNTSEEQRELLQTIGDNCPVMKSLSPEMEVVVKYEWI